jgi:hypothetical protein
MSSSLWPPISSQARARDLASSSASTQGARAFRRLKSFLPGRGRCGDTHAPLYMALVSTRAKKTKWGGGVTPPPVASLARAGGDGGPAVLEAHACPPGVDLHEGGAAIMPRCVRVHTGNPWGGGRRRREMTARPSYPGLEGDELHAALSVASLLGHAVHAHPQHLVSWDVAACHC